MVRMVARRAPHAPERACAHPARGRARTHRGEYLHARMDETIRIFASIATAIVIEAMPFLALGSLLSAVVEVFVSPARVARLMPRGLLGRVALGVSAGVVLPTCECGVVPVARRLLKKGAPGSSVIAYLLSAPIVKQSTHFSASACCRA